MKFVVLGLVFGVIPYVLLSQLMMPALESLQETYRNADAIANRIVQAKPKE